jgi:hypothetical protein
MLASNQIGQALNEERSTLNTAASLSKRPDLDDQIEALQSDASEQYEAYRRTHEHLWKLLSRAYLWWRDASQEDGYLVSLYEQKDIRYHRDGTRPNFNPLIRLVWGIGDIDRADRVTISQWSQALQAMHEQYSQEAQDFNYNPEGKLTALLQSKGGISGLAGKTNAASADDADRARARSPTKRPSTGASDALVTAEISRQALARVNDFVAIGAFTSEEPIRVGVGGLLVLLARRDPTGGITILGSSNDPAQIEAVAAIVARRDLTKLSPSVRALAQIIATQAFPSHALPPSREQRAKLYRTKYADPADLYVSDLEGWEREQRGQPLMSP